MVNRSRNRDIRRVFCDSKMYFVQLSFLLLKVTLIEMSYNISINLIVTNLNKKNYLLNMPVYNIAIMFHFLIFFFYFCFFFLCLTSENIRKYILQDNKFTVWTIFVLYMFFFAWATSLVDAMIRFLSYRLLFQEWFFYIFCLLI